MFVGSQTWEFALARFPKLGTTVTGMMAISFRNVGTERGLGGIGPAATHGIGFAF
jgi:hypothetical protein